MRSRPSSMRCCGLSACMHPAHTSPSITGATALGRNVLSGDQEKIDQFLDFLSAGGSDYAYEMLVDAGVDLATPEPYQAVIAQMNEVMDQMEEILDRRDD